MSRIVKLAAGQSLTIHVAAIELADGEYGQDVKFEGKTPEGEAVQIFVKPDTVDRQFGRIGLATREAALQRALVIAKVNKNGKNFINIDLAQTAASMTGNGAAAIQIGTLTPKPDPLADMFALHDRCWEHANKTLARYDCTPADIAAVAATTFIQASKAGIKA